MGERLRIKFLVLILLFMTGFVLCILYGGTERLSLSQLTSGDFIFWQIRLPKALTAVVAGSTLSVSGLILQVIFRNPLAGPYVLGISSGASLMVAFSILAGNTLGLFSGFFLGKGFIVFSAISGSFIITMLILFISRRVNSNVVLLLIGLMFSQICGAIQTALEYFSDPNSLKTFVIWGMGSLANTTHQDLLLFLPSSAICLLALLFFIKPLNALLLGQNYAQNLGVDFNRNRFYLILVSSLLTGITTAFCGPIAFAGIAVPILSRMIFRSSRQEVHMLACLLIGASLLLFSDVLCHSLIRDIALPLNMITTLLGAPLVIYLMFRNKHW
jgi:iron complex transport system permease protein